MVTTRSQSINRLASPSSSGTANNNEERTRRRARNAAYGRRSYATHRVKNARQRIMNAIADGRCVQDRTRTNPKYEWMEEELRMMDKCIENRRRRYHRHPDTIVNVRDRRYRTQTNTRERSVTPTPPPSPPVLRTPPSTSTADLEMRRVIVQSPVQHEHVRRQMRSRPMEGHVTKSQASNGPRYTIVMDHPDLKDVPWDGVPNDEVSLLPEHDNMYHLGDAKSWIATRNSERSTILDYLGQLRILTEYVGDENIGRIMNLSVDELKRLIRSNPRWNSENTHRKYWQLLTVLCSRGENRRLNRYVSESKCNEIRNSYDEVGESSRVTTLSRTQVTDTALFTEIKQVYKAQPVGSLESALAVLLTLGIYDSKGTLRMIPRIDDVFGDMQVTSQEQTATRGKGNWYVRTNGRLIVRAFKTKRGGRVFYDYKLPTEVRRVVNLYLDQRNSVVRYLFEGSKGSSMDGKLSDLSAKIFGNDLKTRKYRKLVYNYHEQVAKVDKTTLAKAMGNSVTTSDASYRDRDGGGFIQFKDLELYKKIIQSSCNAIDSCA